MGGGRGMNRGETSSKTERARAQRPTHSKHQDTHTLTPAHLDTVSPYTVPTPLLRGRCVAAPAKCDRDTITTNTADAVTSIRSGRPLAVMDFRSHPAPNTLATLPTSLKPPRGTAAVHTDPAAPPPRINISSAAAPLPCLRFPPPIGPPTACLMPPVSHSPRSQPTRAIAESPSPLESWSFLKF